MSKSGSKPAKRNRGKGRPFEPGDDPRRNMGGNLNAEAQSWAINYRNGVAQRLSGDQAAEIDSTLYRKNRPGVQSDVKDRMMDKPNQPHSGEVMIHILDRVVKTGTSK